MWSERSQWLVGGGRPGGKRFRRERVREGPSLRHRGMKEKSRWMEVLGMHEPTQGQDTDGPGREEAKAAF